MEELACLTEILNNYDYREVISVGIGAVFGLLHASYHNHYRSKVKVSRVLMGTSAGISSIINSEIPISSFFRDFGNAFVGGISYVAFYNASYWALEGLTYLKNR